jgi:hypothetical protein
MQELESYASNIVTDGRCESPLLAKAKNSPAELHLLLQHSDKSSHRYGSAAGACGWLSF